MALPKIVNKTSLKLNLSMSDLAIAIRHCKRSRSSKLDLSSRELKSLPVEIWDLKNLEELDLSNNKLDTLDEKIGGLTGLKFLDLSNNNLLSLPRTILGLKALVNLNVSYNPLKSEFLILSQKENQVGSSLKSALAGCFSGSSLSLGPDLGLDSVKPSQKISKPKSDDIFGGSSFASAPKSHNEGFASTSLGFYKKPVTSSEPFQLSFKNEEPHSKMGHVPHGNVKQLESMLKAEQKKVLELERKLSDQNRNETFFGAKTHVGTAGINKNIIEIAEGDLIEKDKISQGGFSLILCGFFRGTPVAIKKIFDPNVTDEVLQEFNNELNILNKFRHPNIVQLIAASVKAPKLVIVMELFAKGSLYDIIQKRK